MLVVPYDEDAMTKRFDYPAPKYYILAGRNPLAVPLMVWARWFETADRRIAFTEYGKVSISTVFLGLDHSFDYTGKSPPILFESMIFGGQHDGYTDRCATYDEAEAMHKATCAMVKQLRVVK